MSRLHTGCARTVLALGIIVTLGSSGGCKRGSSGIDDGQVAARPGQAWAATGRATGPASGAADGATAVDVRRFHALLINGGGNAAQNYQSHHLHVTTLVDQLKHSGLPPERISILASDGTNPGADMAVRAAQPEAGFWMLQGTPIEDAFRTPVTFANSAVPGIKTAPATKAALRSWFAGAKKQLRPGDTLLLYVTDHGTQNQPDPRNNEITLWGEALSVDDLGGLLATLDPGVRVVSLMSQCFSGGFARLYEARRPNPQGGGFCGYFASTADRPAYGCYPENKDKNNVGHSFHFFSALAEGRAFSAAHREVLVTDQTPDVPLQTSDAFLTDVLTAAARTRNKSLDAFADELLKQAWKNGKTWEPEIRLLDRVGQTYGMWSARSLAELEAQAGLLPDFSKKVEKHKEAWDFALGDLNYGRLARWTEQNPVWKKRLAKPAVEALDQPARRKLAAELLAALEGFPLDQERLATVRERSDLTAALAYRLEVRLGVVLRVRTRLLNIAGRVYVAKHGSAAEQRTLAELLACEGLRLPNAEQPRPPLLTAKPAFPPFKDDLDLAQKVLPGWMGIHFGSVSAEMQKKYQLPSGAAFIRQVYVGSPAEVAGLRAGDILIGPRGQPFTGHNEVRVWTFLSQPGQPRNLDVLRSGERLAVTLTPRPFPGELPALPGPPKAGSKAPPLSLAPYRGKLSVNLTDGTPHLLFFWGTYCGPCKASLPELLAFGKQRKVQVIAISDEPRATLDEFFASWKQPFPEIVAHDEQRAATVAFGTSGVPTFVYVDGQGVIRSLSVGYGENRGIGVPDWSYPR